MKETGKLDYIEFSAGAASLAEIKAFYGAAFGWSFSDYGPTYSAFDEGLEGGFQAEPGHASARPLAIIYSDALEATQQDVVRAGGVIVRPIFSFPGGRRFHFTDPARNELAVWGE